MFVTLETWEQVYHSSEILSCTEDTRCIVCASVFRLRVVMEFHTAYNASKPGTARLNFGCLESQRGAVECVDFVHPAFCDMNLLPATGEC